jgi:hypothetical protein
VDDVTTFFLYEINTYYADPTISDQWDFRESVINFEQHHFASFESVREYCINNWKADPISFLARYNTHIP